MSLGLFAVGNYGGGIPSIPAPGVTGSVVNVKGILYGGSADQFIAQVKGSATITVATLLAGFTLMYSIKFFKQLRISEEGEIEGLDIHEHGAPAYHPEPAYNGYSAMPPGKTGGGTAPGVPASAMVET